MSDRWLNRRLVLGLWLVVVVPVARRRRRLFALCLWL